VPLSRLSVRRPVVALDHDTRPLALSPAFIGTSLNHADRRQVIREAANLI
jgi:hypothetical protein